uniref:Putative ovule protein n=1 Tax=Solanum chacoense TaxID=4108 RepID=A0A0V0HNI1_SOLCH
MLLHIHVYWSIIFSLPKQVLKDKKLFAGKIHSNKQNSWAELITISNFQIIFFNLCLKYQAMSSH